MTEPKPGKLAIVLHHLTPSNVLKWTGVIFLVCLMILFVISVIITMAYAFS